MNVLKLIASSSFITVNKGVARELGMTEAIILGVLCSGYAYFESIGELNGDFFPFSTNRLREETTFGETAQRNALSHLEEVGVIEQKNFGNPQTRHFRINEDALIQILRNQGTIKSDAIKESIPTPSRNYINNNNTNDLNNNSLLIKGESDENEELSIDEKIDMTIEAWNNNKNIRAKIDRIPFQSKRYNNMFLCIAEYGWDRFIKEIRSIDCNKAFGGRKKFLPVFEWIVDPNIFMKLADGYYAEEFGNSDQEEQLDELKEWAKQYDGG